MALKSSKLKEIPQRNKDLAFGYLRGNEKKNKSNYPQLIKYLVLIYSNQQDRFDPKATHKHLNIDGNCVTDTRISDRSNPYAAITYNNCYLKNVAMEGIHIWKFKYYSKYDGDDNNEAQVGVWKSKYGDPRAEDGATLIDNTTKDNKTCTEYVITMDGRRTTPHNPEYWNHLRYHPRPKQGDIIEMNLDLNKLTLTFKVRGEIVVIFNDIEDTSYRAAVATYRGQDKFELISYQDKYQ